MGLQRNAGIIMRVCIALYFVIGGVDVMAYVHLHVLHSTLVHTHSIVLQAFYILCLGAYYKTLRQVSQEVTCMHPVHGRACMHLHINAMMAITHKALCCLLRRLCTRNVCRSGLSKPIRVIVGVLGES